MQFTTTILTLLALSASTTLASPSPILAARQDATSDAADIGPQVWTFNSFQTRLVSRPPSTRPFECAGPIASSKGRQVQGCKTYGTTPFYAFEFNGQGKFKSQSADSEKGACEAVLNGLATTVVRKGEKC
ncbi:MAG: hypothetical protein M1835_006825 [Candelina submexicana]|nr:MAG: hypothetical protein M1835_006825 [Candelina submexicana]